MNLQSKELLINCKNVPGPDSEEYRDFWKNEALKIREGVTVNGYYFSPFLYWHLNLWSIYKDEMVKGRQLRVLGRPDFWDSFIKIEATLRQAEEHPDGKKGVAIVGSRRLSKSVLITSYVAHKAIAYKNTEILVSGGNQPDLKNLTDYIDLGLRNLPDYFRFSRIEDDWKKGVTLGFKEKANNIRHEWAKIHVRNFDDGNNTEAAAGLTLSGFLLDEGGKFPFLRSLAATTPCFDSAFGWRCTPIITATGGDMKKARDMQELFYNPEAYNFLAVDVKDDNTAISLFIPGTQSLKIPRTPQPFSEYLGIEKGSELDELLIHVADEEKGRELILQDRERIKKASGMEAYLKEMMYYPLNADECFLDMEDNIFPVDLLQQQLNYLESGGYTKEVTHVELYRDVNNQVKHKPTDKKPVQSYPAKPNEDNTGVIQIYEFPLSDAPYGLYTAGCLTPGEKVLTQRGLVNVEEVTYKDKLINQDGELVDILTLIGYDLKNEDTYTLKMSNTFRTTRFTQEHPIYVSNAAYTSNKTLKEEGFDFSYQKASEIKKGQWVKVPNIYKYKSTKDFKIDLNEYWINDNFRIDRTLSDNPLLTSDFWWFIGLWLGDGYTLSNSGKISISLNTEETYYIERLKGVVKQLFKRSPEQSFNETKTCVELTFTFQQLSRFLDSHFGKYAETKIVPEWVKRLPDNYKVALLEGYLDSDGSITKHTDGYYNTEFVSISLELLESIQDILFSLGIVSNLSKLRDAGKSIMLGKSINQKKCYHLRFGNQHSIKFKTLINNPQNIKLTRIDDTIAESFQDRRRRGCFLSKDEKYIYFQIKKIETEKYTGPVYNFECVTNTFMCHHITTHNCDPYKQSQAHYSTSLGATYIFKRVHNLTGERFQNMIVASYIGRPKKIQDWYEETRKLLDFYNCKTLCENMDMGFIDFCIQNRDADRYLEKTPSILREDIHANTTVNRTYGIHTSSGIKDYINSLIIEYLQEVIEVQVTEEGEHKQVLGVSRILDPMLIKELLKYSPKANADRKDAFGYTLLMAKNLARRVVVQDRVDNRFESYKKIGKKSNSLFNRSKLPFLSK